MNETHKEALRSWVASANHPDTDFPIQNLPFGVFRRAGHARARIGVAIGDWVLDLYQCSAQKLLPAVCQEPILNDLLGEAPSVWAELRLSISRLLREGSPVRQELLLPAREVEMVLPVHIGDYTDFYSSIHHATRVGKLFRPENPLLPNYRYVPIAYHGRASSVVVSGTPVRRPCGQIRPQTDQPPIFGETKKLDYELELGFLIGPGNSQFEPIRAEQAEGHVFGACLLNDWSARDIQSWESQPLGPFLAKNFATTISPWLVTMEALEPFRVEAHPHEPEPLDYLKPAGRAFDITLEVWLNGSMLTRGNSRDLFWTLSQMIAHHTCNGCNLRTADLLATGTISGEARESAGCLLELGGDFLKDGDEVVFRGYCEADGFRRIGFGECRGVIDSRR